jgi:hypothetical protein
METIMAIYLAGFLFAYGIGLGAEGKKKQSAKEIVYFVAACVLSWIFVGFCIGSLLKEAVGEKKNYAPPHLPRMPGQG